MSSAENREKTPPLPADVQAKIGEKLKAYYDDLVNQPVPDRFRELLLRLDSTAPAPGGSSREAGR